MSSSRQASVSYNRPSMNGPEVDKGFCGDIDWIVVLRGVGVVASFVFIALGIYNISNNWRDVKSLVNSLYQILFGLLGIAAEFRWQRLLKSYFQFLTIYVGIGLWYVFLGGLAAGQQWWDWVMCVTFWSLSSIYLILGCFCAKRLPPISTRDAEERRRETFASALLGNQNNSNNNRDSRAVAAVLPSDPYGRIDPKKEMQTGLLSGAASTSSSGSAYDVRVDRTSLSHDTSYNPLKPPTILSSGQPAPAASSGSKGSKKKKQPEPDHNPFDGSGSYM